MEGLRRYNSISDNNFQALTKPAQNFGTYKSMSSKNNDKETHNVL